MRRSVSGFLLPVAVIAFLVAPLLVQAQSGQDTGIIGVSQEEADALGAGVKPNLNVPIPYVNLSAPVSGDQGITIPFLGQYVSGVYTFLISIVGVVAGFMILVGGYQYLTAGGDKGRVDQGRRRVINALTGLSLAFGSYLLLYTINPDLVEFKSLSLLDVDTEISQSEASSDPEEVTTPQFSCSDPGFAIDDLSSFDPNLKVSTYSHVKRKLTPDRVAVYKRAADRAGVPWEVLATIHQMEAGMDAHESILNGGPLCNTRDDPQLLSSCSACRNATAENDLFCGAQKIAQKVGGGFTKDDLDTVKLAFCMYNGCNSARRQCPELHHYVAANFDRQHTEYFKTGVDCLWKSCKQGCTMDVTKKGSGEDYGRGCCTIKVYKPGQEPAGYDPGGSKCHQNVRGQCLIAETSTTATYQYFPGDRTQDNPCGTRIRQNRAGALGVFAYILQLEEEGAISP